MMRQYVKNLIPGIKRLSCFVTIFFLISCAKKVDNDPILLSSDIVFFNIEHASRQEIGKSIDLISKCSPKVIGVNAVFSTPHTSTGDSLLLAAISRAGNVVLSFAVKGNEINKSDSAFIKASRSVGMITYLKDGDVVVDFEVFTSFNNQLQWSFPAVIASEFDFDKNKILMEQTKADTGYEVTVYSTSGKFNSLPKTEAEINCDLIKDKIVLLGYLGPKDEDMVTIENTSGKEKVYSTVILANIINSILEDDVNQSNR